jgi:hypothetical protein
MSARRTFLAAGNGANPHQVAGEDRFPFTTRLEEPAWMDTENDVVRERVVPQLSQMRGPLLKPGLEFASPPTGMPGCGEPHYLGAYAAEEGR